MSNRWPFPPGISPTYKNLALIGLAVILFVILFFLLWPIFGERVTLLISIPIVACAWLLGVRAGLVAWVLAVPGEMMLLSIVGHLNMAALQSIAIELALLLGAVMVVERLHWLSDKMARQLAERQALEQALHENQRFSRTITDTLPDVIYLFDTVEQRNIYVNSSVESILGYTPEAIIGEQTMSKLTHPDDLVRLAQEVPALYGSLSEREPISYEYRMRHINGEWRWMRSREVVFARNPDGTPRHVLGIAHDITEEKKIAETLFEHDKLQLALEKELELANLKTRLMTTISHEFRTPLSIALASAEMLERYLGQMSPERRDEAVNAIKTQILSLRDMLNDINNMLHEERSQPVFTPSRLDLAEVCHAVVDELRVSTGEIYSLHFRNDGVPPIMGDESLLRPILRNLLNNAIKYSSPGDPIECRIYQEGDQAVIEIRDQGIGIPSDDQERIFDTFHRAPNVANIGGLGLGLKIVRDYVALHQGTITIVSHVGDGTTVTVRLPIQPNDLAAV